MKKLILIGVIMFSFIFNLFRKKEPVKMTERLPVTELKPSAKAYDIIKEFEGLRFEAYQCSANVWTIGYGSTVYKDGTKVKQGDTIDGIETAQELLESHVVNNVCPELPKYITAPLKQTEYDALCSFVYNLGPAGLFTRVRRSNGYSYQPTTIVRLINNEDYEGAAGQFGRWTLADGKRLGGLIRRRQAEKELFLS